MEKWNLVKEIHGNVRINFPRRKYIIKHLDYMWHSDLCDFQNLKKHNKNYCYVLIVIDCFSKFCWARSLKTKTGKEVKEAFNSIFEETRRSPKYLVVDEGNLIHISY